MKSILTSSVILSLVAFCKPYSSSKVNLVGGELVTENNLTSAVQISDFCGAVRISDKAYLTAAHCLVSVQTFG